ncbi:amidase [Sporosarcina sp. YIM B06819]|uniref:amidase n=1 Tax=Sporosarcina sp. YIM B06819 TaxID=3081769 RepID=UPI00298D4B6B|nr:amidase [Sporosarcina sp. YIM B06819]
MNIDTYLRLDATDLSELIRKKEVKPSELVELSFGQLEKVNPALNAVTHMRRERVLDELKRVEVGNHPFAGVPILLKNISQALQGEAITSGSKLLSTTVAGQDSHFVKKLREAGFLFIGHTNTPEFGLKNITEPELYGATRNPWNPDYSSGGSSGGSAAAIASGIVPLAGASDGGGSIRIPASFSSLVGLKPTRGRTPVGPGVGRQWQGASIDFVLSRSVRDSAAMLDQLQVVQQAAAFQTPLLEGSSVDAICQPIARQLKIAFTTKSPVATPVSEEAQAAVKKVVRWLESEGHIVEELDNQVDGIQLMRDYFLMNSGEMAAVVEQLEQAVGRALTANDVEIETWLLNEAGKSVSAAKYSASLASWDTAAAQMAIVHESYDLYITPATAFAAPKIGELTHSKAEQEQLRFKMDEASGSEQQQAIIYDMFLPSLTYTPFTQLANLTGQPAISMPVHLTKEGLPIGVQVMAGKGEERLLLQLAAQLEQTDLWVGMKGNPLFE